MTTYAGQMQTATVQAAAYLNGGTTPTLAAMQLITNGTLTVTINGVPINATALDFSGAASLPACATIINAAVDAQGGCNWVATRFVIFSDVVGPEGNVSFATGTVAVPAMLRAVDGAAIVAGTSPLGPQWIPCNGRTFYPQRWHSLPSPGFPLPHAAPSFGDGRDWLRNVNRYGGAYRIHNRLGGLCRVPYDPSGQYYVSVADTSAEADLPANTYTVQRPPPGVK